MPSLMRRKLATKDCWCIAKQAKVRSLYALHMVSDQSCCQEGRSVAIVAAYLMHSRDLDPDSALSLIRKVRPSIE